jgi:hypothetical protein
MTAQRLSVVSVPDSSSVVSVAKDSTARRRVRCQW